MGPLEPDPIVFFCLRAYTDGSTAKERNDPVREMLGKRVERRILPGQEVQVLYIEMKAIIGSIVQTSGVAQVNYRYPQTSREARLIVHTSTIPSEVGHNEAAVPKFRDDLVHDPTCILVLVHPNRHVTGCFDGPLNSPVNQRK